MDKKIIEFSQADNEGEHDIEVVAHAMTSAEFKAVRIELDNLNFQYQHIDADSIRAKFTGSYDATMTAMLSLEEKGWTW